MNVGTKELKNHLSHYLGRVRDGETVRVTDRGKVVAEIRAVVEANGDDDTCLTRLQTAGLVTVGTGRFAKVRPVKLRAGTSASAAILADRG